MLETHWAQIGIWNPNLYSQYITIVHVITSENFSWCTYLHLTCLNWLGRLELIASQGACKENIHLHDIYKLCELKIAITDRKQLPYLLQKVWNALPFNTYICTHAFSYGSFLQQKEMKKNDQIIYCIYLQYVNIILGFAKHLFWTINEKTLFVNDCKLLLAHHSVLSQFFLFLEYIDLLKKKLFTKIYIF